MLELINDACNFDGPEKTAATMAEAIRFRGGRMPGFYFFHLVWISPKDVTATLAALHRRHPELDFEVLDPTSFFALFKQSQEHR